jgi:CRISPR system Cascade subunit CasB
LADVSFVPVYHRLFRSIQRIGGERDEGPAPVRRDGLAVVAGVVSHVEDIRGRDSFAVQMARPEVEGGGSKVSELRFRRLLQYRNRDDLYPALIRIVKLLDGQLDLFSLATAAYWWNDRTRKDWAYEYYSEAPEKERSMD